MADDSRIMFWPLYRWAGTTPEFFESHYRDVHSKFGPQMGATWYETFFNKNPSRDWPHFGSPVPDAYTIEMLSATGMEAIEGTALWQEILDDCVDWMSHSPAMETRRYTWIPEPRDDDAETGPTLVIPMYRWPGTTHDEFLEHHVDVHSAIGKRLPGVTWYETLANKAPRLERSIDGAPPADATDILMFESEAAMAEARTSPEWEEWTQDATSFLSHVDVFEMERVVWSRDPEVQRAFTT
jgi:uncharacterized protein (TIGR02118 family)